MPFAKSNDGTAIHYQDWGSGRPVVLIHGWPLNADSWEYQSVALVAAGFRVIAPDRRGFGRSGQPWTGYDYDTFADDVATVLDDLDIHDAVIVGFSMGGGEVARLAGGRNPRIGKAVFLSAVTPFMLKCEDNPEGVDKSVFDGMIAGLADDRPTFLSQFGTSFYGTTMLGRSVVPDAIRHWSLMMALIASPRATIECVRAFSGTDFRADLQRIAIPTLIIHGTGDQTVPIEVSAHRTVKLIGDASLIEYEGASHGLFFTERARLVEDLIAFCR